MFHYRWDDKGFITLPIAEKHLTIDKQIITNEENQKLDKLARALETQNKEIDQPNPKSCDVPIATKKIERMTVLSVKRIKQKLAEFQITRLRGNLT